MDTDRSGDWRGRLESLALIGVSGGDSATFLQGQLSNDVSALGPARPVQLSSLSTARGRVFAVMLVIWRAEGEFLLLLPKAGADDVLNRLRMFVLRSKVTLEAVAGRFTGLSGTQAAAEGGREFPESPWAGRWHDGHGLLVRWPDPQARALLLELDSTEGDEQANVDARWQQRDISAGVAWITDEGAREEFVAQMLDLDLLEGISFDKGCYTGQEVIARTHYLGRVKRRLRRYGLAADSAPAQIAPGASIEAETGDGEWRKAGAVVLAAGEEILAVMQLDQAEAPLRLEGSEDRGSATTLTSLPLPR